MCLVRVSKYGGFYVCEQRLRWLPRFDCLKPIIPVTVLQNNLFSDKQLA